MKLLRVINNSDWNEQFKKALPVGSLVEFIEEEDNSILGKDKIIKCRSLLKKELPYGDSDNIRLYKKDLEYL